MEDCGDDQTLVYAAHAEDHTLKIMGHSGGQETMQYEHLVGSAGGDDQTLVYAAAPEEDQTLKYLGGGGGPATSSNDAELPPVRKRRNVRANVPLADASLTMGHLSPPAPIVIDSDDGEEECTHSTAEREACRGQGSLAAGGRGQKEEENQAAKRPRPDVAKGREGDSISQPSDGGLSCSWECSACTFINASTRSVACGMCAVEREVSTKWAAQTSQREQEDDEGNKGFSVISTWSCQICTLKNRGSIDALCAVCESPRDYDNSSSCYSSKSSSCQSAADNKPSEKIAREVQQKKEMEERTLLVRAEQKRKKEDEKKVKQQLEEDRMIRKMKKIVKVKNLSADELQAHVEAIETFVAENGRPKSDILADLLETLKVHTIPVTNAGGQFAMDMARSVVLVDVSRAMGADLQIAKKEILHMTKEKTMQMGGKTNMGLVTMGSTGTKHGLELDGYPNVFTVRNIKERNMEQSEAITEACNNLTVQEEECTYANGLMVALDMLVKTESRRGNEPNGKVYLVSNGKSDFNPQDDELIEIMDMMCDHLKRKEILLTVLGINFSSDDAHTWSTGEAMLRDLVKRSGGTLKVVRNVGNQSDTRLRFFTGPLSSLQGLVTTPHTARNPQKGNVGASGGSSSSRALNSADLAALAAERKRRDQARGAVAERAAVAAGQKYPDDPALMRGEAEARAAKVVQRWKLCDDGNQRPLAFLEPAGLTHLAIIKNALAFREPSVKLLKAQYICNPQLMEGFEKLRREHPSHHVVHLFHGTSENNLESIIANGFLVKHAQSGGGLIWFSRQSTYSYAFTMNQGKGLSGQPANFVPSGPSGKMFVCQLLVARRSGPTSNVGDNGQDVITMTNVNACLPLYLIHTTYDQMGLNGLYGSHAPSPFIAPGMLGASQGLVTSIRQVMGSYAAFAGKGERLGK